MFDTNINIYTCQLFSELNSSELIARVFARAATTVDTDASEPRLDGGYLVKNCIIEWYETIFVGFNVYLCFQEQSLLVYL